ncbi:MAG: hypothetical protein NBV65_07505 [Burkholderiaceae bacterium]|nr:hypothetical protein [Burkholderiaceae bacterium]
MMTPHLSKPLEVWNNGLLAPLEPWRLDLVEFHNEIRRNTGAKFCVATRWTYQDSTFENPNCPVPIPDMSGLVYATAGWKQWVVINPDGTTKLVINVPRVSNLSVPENGELGMPRHMTSTPLNIMYGEGSDGYRDDCRFFFDMHTGLLERVEFVGRHW